MNKTRLQHTTGRALSQLVGVLGRAERLEELDHRRVLMSPRDPERRAARDGARPQVGPRIHERLDDADVAGPRRLVERGPGVLIFRIDRVGVAVDGEQHSREVGRRGRAVQRRHRPRREGVLPKVLAGRRTHLVARLVVAVTALRRRTRARFRRLDGVRERLRVRPRRREVGDRRRSLPFLPRVLLPIEVDARLVLGRLGRVERDEVHENISEEAAPHRHGPAVQHRVRLVHGHVAWL
mmetsp:Transcript_3364/g.12940  ORF Transcript_3364/g.12940 Transcript_3364/m.12940 type:complete len:238 (+) Transcript_3364:1406-2119(+)